MPDLLAIISKAVFEAFAKTAKVGEVLSIDRYTSENKALAPLGDGGRLFLVTVRPPAVGQSGEQLWLVAVLESPRRRSGAWVAANNVVPIADLAPVRSRIKFASGTGISAKSGALGMSLQTPRQLTAGDVVLLGAATQPVASPKPARVPKSKRVAAPKSKLPAAPKSKAKAPKPVPEVATDKPAASALPPAREAELRDRLSWLVEHGTVGHSYDERKFLEEACREDTLRAAPFIGDLVRAIDPVKLLQRQLQGGVLDEWYWPAQDEAADRLGEDSTGETDSIFPHVLLRTAKRLIVVGPDAIVLDTKLALPAKAKVWSTLFVEGDVLVVYEVGSRMEGVWLADGKRFKAGSFGGHIAVPGIGSANGAEARPIVRGKTIAAMFHDKNMRMVFCEGGLYYRTQDFYGSLEGFDRKGRSKHDHFEQFDPATGAAIKPGLPSWFAERLPDAKMRLIANCSFVFPVPARAENSPLGAKAGLGALITRREPDGTFYAEGVDGRSWRGPERPVTFDEDGDPEDDSRAGLPLALMTFPERDGSYPVVFAADDRWQKILLPDRRTVLVPDFDSHVFWGGISHRLRSSTHHAAHWLHLFEPRDPEVSRQLRATTEVTARALLAAADPSYAANPDLDREDDPAKRLRPLAHWPDVASAVRAAFPRAADRLVAGIVMLAMQAAEEKARLVRMLAQVAAAAEPVDAPAVAVAWDEEWTDDWSELFSKISRGNRINGALDRHLRSVEHFLFADTPPPAGPAVAREGEPSLVWWEPLFLHQGQLLFRIFALATPNGVRARLRELLGFWATTKLATRCDELRYLGVEIPKSALPEGTNLATFVHQRNRYVYRVKYGGDSYHCYVVERTTDGVFVDPPDAKIAFDERPQRFWHGEDKLAAALRVFDEHGAQTELDPEVFVRIADGTGISVTAAALAWLGAIQPWIEDVPKQLRKQLGVKVADLERAVNELSSADLGLIYSRAMPDDAMQLRTPLERGSEPESAVERFVRAWNETAGKQQPLQLDLVARLELELRGAPIPAVHAIRVLEDPASVENLAVDARWVVRPYETFKSNVSYSRGYIPAGWPKPEAMGQEEATNHTAIFDGRVLRYYLRYIPWAHQDLPVGHPLRRNAAMIAARIRDRLANPELLLLAGAIDLSRQTDGEQLANDFHDVVDRFRGAPYRAVDGGASAPGFDRGDLVVTWPAEAENGVFFAFRPARIRDARGLEQLAAALGIADAFRRNRGGCACGLNFGRHDVVDITDLTPWLAWITPGFQALVAELESPAVASGRYVSDPRASRPDLVALAREQRALSEDEATLWLQIRTLADPTPERILRINEWNRERLERTGEALIDRGLVVAGKHPRTSRTWFAPGGVIVPLRPAAAIEVSKVALYGLDSDGEARPPFGMVLPLRPLAELFADAMSFAAHE